MEGAGMGNESQRVVAFKQSSWHAKFPPFLFPPFSSFDRFVYWHNHGDKKFFFFHLSDLHILYYYKDVFFSVYSLLPRLYTCIFCLPPTLICSRLFKLIFFFAFSHRRKKSTLASSPMWYVRPTLCDLFFCFIPRVYAVSTITNILHDYSSLTSAP